MLKNDTHAGEVDAGESTITITSRSEAGREETEIVRQLGRAFSLGICYSARIGGFGSLTGTTNNLLGKDYIDELV